LPLTTRRDGKTGVLIYVEAGGERIGQALEVDPPPAEL
jgi:hypothetical protein